MGASIPSQTDTVPSKPTTLTSTATHNVRGRKQRDRSTSLPKGLFLSLSFFLSLCLSLFLSLFFLLSLSLSFVLSLNLFLFYHLSLFLSFFSLSLFLSTEFERWLHTLMWHSVRATLRSRVVCHRLREGRRERKKKERKKREREKKERKKERKRERKREREKERLQP